MKESDWKIFKKVKAQALERFCAKVISEIAETMGKDFAAYHDKYLYIYTLIVNADKRLGFLFDNHSRSKAQRQLMLMRREGLVDSSELEGMSHEFLKATEPVE